MKPTSIILPPKSSSSLLASGLQSSPHTPLPYATNPLKSLDILHLSHHQSTVTAGSKRQRGRDSSSTPWTEQENEILQSILVHPYEPLSEPFPPGQLPPPKILDELVAQLTNISPTGSTGWRHTWDETREKLFAIALQESQTSQGAGRFARESRNRPNMRRVDSMDFLDQREEQDSDPGRALRLSTSLQKSAKQSKLSPKSSTSIVVSPASPASPRSRLHLHHKLTNRPSLLQRGRSFTAEDLASQAERAPTKKVNGPIPRSASSSCLMPQADISVSRTGRNDSDEGDALPVAREVKKLRSLTRMEGDHGLQSPFEEKAEFI